MLKKIISLLAALAIVPSALLPASAETEYRQVERKNPNSLLILGDSIATGYGLDGYTAGNNSSAANYGSMLKEEYGLTNDTYRNYAVDGQTSTQLLEKLSQGVYDDYLVCETVVISIGGNDLLDVILDPENGVFGENENSDLKDLFSGKVSAEEFFASLKTESLKDSIGKKAEENINTFKENLTKIIAKIKEVNPDCQIVLQTLYDPMHTGIDYIDDIYAENINKMNQVINSAENAVKADVYSAFEASGGELIQRDFTHPNAEGHKLIYSAVSKCIDEQCVFYNTVEVEKTTVQVQKPKKHLKKYVAAICVFSGAAVVCVIAGVAVRISRKRSKEK